MEEPKWAFVCMGYSYWYLPCAKLKLTYLLPYWFSYLFDGILILYYFPRTEKIILILHSTERVWGGTLGIHEPHFDALFEWNFIWNKGLGFQKIGNLQGNWNECIRVLILLIQSHFPTLYRCNQEGLCKIQLVYLKAGLSNSRPASWPCPWPD